MNVTLGWSPAFAAASAGMYFLAKAIAPSGPPKSLLYQSKIFESSSSPGLATAPVGPDR